ncbi:hypothetical protein [Enterococcus xiangfangensis]|uniref:Uncharacterized protein n=1 Tax=Enterococcus xiangfangensis TaxID=1296537 RepID=A0ABU3F671_9ENTE|nr:hypothetical protein [Enterococcus xiangfangensis]MDT2758168.1 hypothetical protein [Enterococcus xiangfangensis]NBK09161.1 hypothetical protein [Enterococcus asini]
MKKAVWIFSINVDDGGAPFGYAFNLAGWRIKKFQEEIKEELLPDIDLEFISYDVTTNQIPAADIVIFNDKDSRFIADTIRKNGLSIPYQDVYIKDTKKIKDTILTFFNTTKI